MPILTSIRIVIRAFRQFAANGDAQMGAALAYYALFSTSPLLILAVMFAGLFFDEAAAREQVRVQLTRTIGPEIAREVTTWMEHGMRPAHGTWALTLSLAILLFGTLGVFLHLRNCLCIIWKLAPPGGSGILMTILNYVLAIIAVLCMGVLLLVSLGASTAMSILVDYVEGYLPGNGSLWYWLEAGVSFLLLTLFFAVVYRVMSGRRIPWGYVLYGSIITSLLFTFGKMLIGWYLAHSSTTSIYGAAGSAVVFLVWIYYSAQIAFFGAELIQARRTRHEWMGKTAGAT